MEFNNEFSLKFLAHYRTEPALWDALSPQYKDRKENVDAWIRLSESLQIPIPELKKKKDSLMATFRGHKRKKEASIRSGATGSDIYKPIWFAYEIMESFLAPEINNTDQVRKTQILISILFCTYEIFKSFAKLCI